MKLPKLTSQSLVKIDYLRESRINRLKNKKNKRLKAQIQEMNDKIKETMPRYFQSEQPKKGKKGSKYLPPIGDEAIKKDIKFLFNPNYDGLESPRLRNPEEEKLLFVTKPIGNYEPVEDLMNKLFDPDANTKVKPLSSKPSTHFVMRDINQTLDGHMLKKIHAGPKIIEFGEMFIKSMGEKFFFVRNDMKNAISVRLLLDDEAISMSYEKPQILMSGQTAGFRVNFKSNKLGRESKIITYILNEKHKFKFMIKADVIPVKLKLSTKQVDIKFSDDNLDMEASEIVKVTNNGNANARFSWFSPSTSFTFVPNTAIVKPGTSLPVRIFF